MLSPLYISRYRPKALTFIVQAKAHVRKLAAKNRVLFILLRNLIYKEGLSIMGSLLPGATPVCHLVTGKAISQGLLWPQTYRETWKEITSPFFWVQD
jgi:hypothetical protein